MKIIGWILVISAVLIIIYNVAETAANKRLIREYNKLAADEPIFTTLFVDLPELKPVYTFTPPYTGFECTVISAGLIGVGILIVRLSRDKA